MALFEKITFCMFYSLIKLFDALDRMPYTFNDVKEGIHQRSLDTLTNEDFKDHDLMPWL